MTNEEAESELMQIYMSLSEEKKKALDVAFKAMEQADNIPVMYYPQVDGITPTVVAQADGERKMRDATSEEREAIDKYIKSISKPTGINFWDLDDNDDCISRKAVLSLLADHFDNVFDMVKELPSVAIPSAEPREVLYSGDGYADGEMVYDMAECMNCGREFEYGDETWGCTFCPDCGQALKWEGEQE